MRGDSPSKRVGPETCLPEPPQDQRQHRDRTLRTMADNPRHPWQPAGQFPLPEIAHLPGPSQPLRLASMPKGNRASCCKPGARAICYWRTPPSESTRNCGAYPRPGPRLADRPVPDPPATLPTPPSESLPRATSLAASFDCKSRRPRRSKEHLSVTFSTVSSLRPRPGWPHISSPPFHPTVILPRSPCLDHGIADPAPHRQRAIRHRPRRCLASSESAHSSWCRLDYRSPLRDAHQWPIPPLETDTSSACRRRLHQVSASP